MLFLKTTPVAARRYSDAMRERAYPIKTNSVLEGLKRRADENPFYGAPAFSKENIVRGAGAGGRGDRAAESGTFHLRSSTPVFNSVRGTRTWRARTGFVAECTFLPLNNLICVIPEASTTNCLRHRNGAGGARGCEHDINVLCSSALCGSRPSPPPTLVPLSSRAPPRLVPLPPRFRRPG